MRKKYDWGALDPVLCDWVAQHGTQWALLSDQLGIPRVSLSKRWEKLQHTEDGQRALRAHVESRVPIRPHVKTDIFDVLDLPPKVLNVSFQAPTLTRGKTVSAVLVPDTHHPFHDQRAIDLVTTVIKDVGPDVVVDMGDGVDAYHLSRFDKDPNRLHTLQDEIDAKHEHLAVMRDAAPNADIHYLEGNHEDRLRRTIWNLDGAAAALQKLRVFQAAMTWPSLLGMDELHITFHGHNVPVRDVLPKFLLVHGTLVRKWAGYTARGEWERWGSSGASGHTHRLALFHHRHQTASHVWAECGCLCRLDMEYVAFADWQNGCVVAHFDTKTGAYNLQPVFIHDGTTVWGKEMLVA